MCTSCASHVRLCKVEGLLFQEPGTSAGTSVAPSWGDFWRKDRLIVGDVKRGTSWVRWFTAWECPGEGRRQILLARICKEWEQEAMFPRKMAKAPGPTVVGIPILRGSRLNLCLAGFFLLWTQGALAFSKEELHCYLLLCRTFHEPALCWFL